MTDLPLPEPFGGALVDSHCHLDRFPPEERPYLVDRARRSGLAGLVTIGTSLAQAGVQESLCALSRPDIRVWCTIGTHPDHAHEEPVPEPEALAARAAREGTIGIGESGLDYFHGGPEVREAQKASFRAHIRAARLADMPVVIHTRDADTDMAALLEEETRQGGAFRFLLHCFSSGRDLAERALALGGYLSFSGIATFNRSDEVRAIAADVPDDRILVETDAPFLAPMPLRGKRNEPAFTVHTARRLAQARGMDEAAFAAMTTANFHRLFTRAA
ncbi:deoxyribonuclease TatD [Ameyamaea chiangmaiensis NBRC 103196]|uniref:TatD family hydrolase n=1 Tax=Ameyamaea chiangmaiensis TaxID=442969 RepID=A0A850P823_9PROT|nr:TatD family hydrolase [Ameyamaea chiangmaiensis]MBS4073601.1 TatD family hydrolase [Ameyamaea chiangmaiensis]NVN40058.1 TatD family hydrolase [Ameyamaea chiangmaiensis]GBQ69120.1 deoxyribonuclease TatD [Ameyamaea chiangmaiensis NBRC 103196]